MRSNTSLVHMKVAGLQLVYTTPQKAMTEHKQKELDKFDRDNANFGNPFNFKFGGNEGWRVQPMKILK